MKHLTGLSCFALGNGRLLATLGVGIGVISIRPRDCRLSRTPAANKSVPLSDGKPCLDRPIGELPCGRARGGQRS